MEHVKEIINAVVIFLTSGTGALLIGVLAKAVISAVSAYKTKKVSKLTEQDKQDIAQTVLDAMQNGIKVDMDAELDRATNRRISAMETRMNEVSATLNQVTDYTKTMMGAVGDFKTISQESRDKIKALLGEPISKVETFPVPEQAHVELSAPAAGAATSEGKRLKY